MHVFDFLHVVLGMWEQGHSTVGETSVVSQQRDHYNDPIGVSFMGANFGLLDFDG